MNYLPTALRYTLNYKQVIIALMIGVALSVFSLSPVSAVETTPLRRLQIAPLRAEIDIKPGTVHKGVIKLKNTGTQPLDVELSAEAFEVGDDTYDYTFLPDSPINEWVHFASQSFTLEASEILPVQYVISVPVDAEPGGAYIGIFGASLPSSDASISSTDRVGSLLYITVSGPVSKTGSLLNFSMPFAGTGDPSWSATLHNTGTAHFTSDYTVELRNLWDAPVSQSGGNSLILPRTVRSIEGTLNHPQWLGLYVAHYSIPLGDNGTATGTRPYLYMPIGQTAALIALIIAAVLFIRTGVHDHSRKKQK